MCWRRRNAKPSNRAVHRTARLGELLDHVDAILASPERRLAAGTALLYLDEDFFVVVRLAGASRSARIRANYFALLDALENDAGQSDTVRLLSAARRVIADKALAGTAEASTAVAMRARTTLDAFLAREHAPDARAGIVNSASWVLSELGDDARLRELLQQQMQVSTTAYYYMPDMADIEERAGNVAAALGWLERGYRESRGPATRFQWGALYVDGLLRMAPADEARIRAAVLQVIGELEGPGRVHARARVRLDKMADALRDWAKASGNQATARCRGPALAADLRGIAGRRHRAGQLPVAARLGRAAQFAARFHAQCQSVEHLHRRCPSRCSRR